MTTADRGETKVFCRSSPRLLHAIGCALMLVVASCADKGTSTGPPGPDTLCVCLHPDTLCCPWLEYMTEHSDRDPAPSPDGKLIAFTRFRIGPDEIWLAESDGSNPGRLTTGTQPDWSPDGTEIAFTRGFDIHVISLADSSVERLTHNGTSNYPDWSPDGRYIAFTCGQLGETCMIEAHGSDGWSVGNGGMPDWSPDGGRIAFLGETEGQSLWSDIWVVDADGQNRRRVTSGQWFHARYPQWSPDGKRIAFVATDLGHAQLRDSIWLIRPDGTGACKLTSGRADGPKWTPDGSSIVYSRHLPGTSPGVCTWTIWALSVQDCSQQQITFPSAGVPGHSGQSPN